MNSKQCPEKWNFPLGIYLEKSAWNQKKKKAHKNKVEKFIFCREILKFCEY